MDVLFFRHGPAGDKQTWKNQGGGDDARPLTRDGRDKTRKAAAGLASLIDDVDVIAASPLTRSAQTADILAKHFKKAKRLVWNELKPDAGPNELLKKISPLKRLRLILVGHEPQLSGLIGELTGFPGLKLELKKAGACLLSLDKPQRGSAKLVWLLSPKQLRALR